jgi:hypothetical protein
MEPYEDIFNKGFESGRLYEHDLNAPLIGVMFWLIVGIAIGFSLGKWVF